MADMKKLLVKLGIGSGDWKTAVKDIKSQLDAFNKESRAKHAEAVSQTRAEIALEKEKAAQIIATVKHIEAQLNGFKGVLAQGKLNEEQTRKILDTAKNLTLEQQHYLTILKNIPAAQDLDLNKMQQKLKISREEFALQEQKMRLVAGATMRKTAPGQASPETVTAGRVSQLQGTLATAQVKTSLAGTEAEIQATAMAYKSGEMQLKAYVAKQTALLTEAHRKKLNLIEQEMLRQTVSVRNLEMLGKKVKVEADLEVKIIAEKNRLIEASEKRRYEMQMRGVTSTVARPTGPGLMGTVTNMAGFMMGGGLGVQMMAAMTAGNALYGVLTKVAEKIKEVMLGSSAEIQLREQFEKLTARAGEDPTAVLEKMRKATRGLVDDQQIFRMSNNFMQSGVKASSDQIAELTKYVVGLARAQGKEAPQAMNSMIRASLTGRTMVLSMVTGLDRQALALKGVGQAMDPITRKNLEFQHTMEVMKKRYDEIGEPQITFKERMQQMNVATKNFYDDFAQSLSKSQGFKIFLAGLATGIEHFSVWAEKAANVAGEYLGPAFALLSIVFASTKDIVGSLWIAFKGLVDLAITPFVAAIKRLAPGLLDSAGGLLSFKNMMYTAAQVAVLMAEGVRLAALAIEMMGKVAKAVATGDLAAAKKAWKDFADEADRVREDTVAKLAKLEDAKHPKALEKTPAAGPKQIPPSDPRAAQAIARAQMALTRALAKEQLELVKDRIEKEKELVDRQYKDGELTQGQFIQARKAQEGALLSAKLLDARVEADAKKKELDEELKNSKIFGEVAALKRRTLDVETRTKSDALWREYYKTINGLDNQSIADLTGARKKYLATVRELEKGEFDFHKKQLEEDFKLGMLTANQYLAIKKEQIQQEHDFAVQAAEDQYKYAVKNEANLAEHRAQLAKADQTREHELTEFKRKELDTRLQAIKDRYGEVQSYLQSLSGIAAEGPGVARAAGISQVQVVAAQQDINEQRLKLLQDQLIALNKLQAAGEIASGEYLHNWMKISGEINQAYLEHVKLNMEMAKAKDYLTPLGNIFNKLASTLGQFSKTFQDAFSRAGSMLEEIGKYKTTVGAQPGSTGNPVKDMLSSFKGLFKGPTDATKSAQQRAQDMMDKMTRSVGTAVGTVDKFGQGLVTTGTTVQKGFDQALTQFQIPIKSTSDALVTLSGAARDAAARLAQISSGGTAGLPAPTGVSGLTGTVPGLGPSAFPSGILPGGTEAPTGSPGIEGVVPGLGSSPMPDLFGNLDDFSKKLQDVTTGPATSFGEKLSTFAQGLGTAVSGIANFIGAIKGAHSAGGGALSGGMAGMSAGAMFGPIGMAVGGIGGAVTGAIFGSKQAAADKQVKQLQAAATNIEKALSAGAIKLGDAVIQLEQVRQNAVQSLSGSKKGRQQLPGVLQGIDQQLDSLRQQQRKTLDDLRKSIAILSAPVQFQDFLGSMDQIIQKYQQFADAAAGSAEELANANKWLVLSFQQYATTQQQDLHKAELDAVNNAIQLIDLQKQRVDLQRQMNQAVADERTQIADVLAQGNKTRQRTAAMQKAQQVYVIQQQFALQQQNFETQKENLAAETAVMADKVAKERQIFDLATTRIDLENQSVQLQEAQTTYDMLRVQALSDLVDKLSKLDFSAMTNLPALLKQLGFEGYTLLPITYTPAYTGMSLTGITNPITVKPPGYQEGTDYVPETGPAILHKGEAVVPAPVTAERVHSIASRLAGSGTVDASTAARFSQEQQIHSMAMTRASTEMQVVKAQKDAAQAQTVHTQLDIQRLSMLRSLISDLRASGNGMMGGDIETLISKLYGVRGRYGSGGFTKEVL